MGTPDKKLSELVDRVKSWIPRKTEPSNLSRDFWMPDQSCRVCYECDAQFTIFNRRHHCRLCGRVFCAKCTANSIPAPSEEPKTGREDWERVRVCNYCFKQWGQGIVAPDDAIPVPSPGLSPSPSATSLASTKSSCTCNSGSTVGSTAYSTGPYQHVPHISGSSPEQSSQFDSVTAEEDTMTSGRITNCFEESKDPSVDQFSSSMKRSDDEDDDFGVCHPGPARRHFTQDSNYYGEGSVEEIDHFYGPHEMQSSAVEEEPEITSLPDSFDSKDVHGMENPGEEVGIHENGDDCEPPLYDVKGTDAEPVDFENNGLLWLPPEPEDEDDEREASLFDDDDDDATGEWGYLHSNSFGTGEYRNRDRSSEEHRRAMKNVVEGHFRALVSQLLQVENLTVGDYDETESWLDIITSLSWEAATLLKPDTSKSGGMDPGGYVKIKCIASGSRNESMVIKGVVCKKNVAHRRMASKIDKARFLILGGALEYQRVSNHLSSFDTLLQQEMDHLKMAVAKIDAHHPNVLLVEKSVSRHAQEYLLAKNITLVLNIKRPLLERISRCTGAQIVPSIDHLTSPKLGYCDTFHVERFFEEHGSAGQGGKKLTKTLMFFEGCPKPLGCTILLKGANGDELKKVKHVVQYGVFAAYHLALETSFLADEGASLPELPLKSPITVALPDKPSNIGRSISTIPGFTGADTKKASSFQSLGQLPYPDTGLVPADGASSTIISPINKFGSVDLSRSVQDPFCQNMLRESEPNSLPPSGQYPSNPYHNEISESLTFEEKDAMGHTDSSWEKTAPIRNVDCFGSIEATRIDGDHRGSEVDANKQGSPELVLSKENSYNYHEDIGSTKEEFPPSPSDHQSILVSLSTRCVWKGTVCDRAHLLRIKYYGSSDKPLGRFLRDHLFDQNYHCPSCDMPSEAHIYCYTHRQGSLTISVKRLPEFLLPGEREGKIWMWHRCLKCPRTNGFPPATRRVVMSDAAWGLSFGKFLELSFSNHAAASRVASCGHSLHRDCLRFYGYGRMVACFRYASISVHSVYLPPSKLEFNYYNQEWIQREANEVYERACRFFTEVQNALRKISNKVVGSGSEDSGMKVSASMHRLAELERILVKEKEEFEELFRKALNKEIKVGQPSIDILEMNKLQRQMLFHSYVWDQRLIYAASLRDKQLQDALSFSISRPKENSMGSQGKLIDVNDTSLPGQRLSSSESGLEKEHNLSLHQGQISSHISQRAGDHSRRDMEVNPKLSENEQYLDTIDKHDLPESGLLVRRAFSEGQFPVMENISDSIDATPTNESYSEKIAPKDDAVSLSSSSLVGHEADSLSKKSDPHGTSDRAGSQVPHSLSLTSLVQVVADPETHAMRMEIPFLNFYGMEKNSLLDAQKFCITEYSPVYIPSFRDLERQSGARLLLPVGVNDTVIPVYDDEPTSAIAYALVSSDYHAQMSESERGKDGGDHSITLPLFDSLNLLSFPSLDDTSDAFRSLGSSDESILTLAGSRSIQAADSQFYTDLHARVSFTDDGPLGKAKYTVTCYYAKRFEALRRTCCPSELDYVRSLSRCKKWGAQGGKSNVFFAKTLDDRFIIKQVTKTELESFIKFAPAYFKYLSESIATGSPTCLAKILGIYQVSSKHFKGGKESKMDVLVMENLLFRRNVTRVYDLKGSSRSRYNPDTSGSNKVLLDQNLIESMPTSPIFVGNKAKRLLERAVWNDTSFLASIDVMDYSLLVGVDEDKHELVLGIIDFMRQYTWDKHLETWVKTSGILGGPKNAPPTVISPQQYKKRFRKAMTAYFLMVPDQWSPPTPPNGSHSELCDENKLGGNSND